MRKIIAIFIGIVFFTILTACSPIPFSYDNSVLVDTVVRVELIYYNQPNVRQVSDFFGNAHRRHLDFNFDLVESIEILNEVYHADFFLELSDIPMQNATNQNNSPTGWSILLHYEDGYFDVFSALYVGRFNHEGRFIEFLGDGLWYQPLRYFIEQHFDHEFQ